jgi:NADH dehydrogenase
MPIDSLPLREGRQVLLLTGATGTVGQPLLRRLTAAGVPVRCLVRDPRRLDSERVRVQIALGDLADPFSFRHALRGVDTVVHLASTIRDQPGGSIEELDGIAAWRLVKAAERAGVERFVFFSTLGASTRSRARLMRAKAIAERALLESSLTSTIFAPSMVYSPSDPFITLLERMSLLPVMPISGSGRAGFQPIWAEDVADCVISALPGGPMGADSAGARYELAGPETVTYREFVSFVLRSLRRRRPIVPIPTRVARRTLKLAELLMGPAAFATWDEAELLEVPLISRLGTADAERLGVVPKPMQAVLGVG